MSKSGLRKHYKTNLKTSATGVWMELPEAANEDGTIPAFLIRRIGVFNTDHSVEIEKLTAKYAGRKMTREEAVQVTREAFVKHGMAGWRNVQNDQGEDVSYTVDACAVLFEELPDVYEKAVVFGNDMDNYKAGALEEDAKN